MKIPTCPRVQIDKWVSTKAKNGESTIKATYWMRVSFKLQHGLIEGDERFGTLEFLIGLLRLLEF